MRMTRFVYLPLCIVLLHSILLAKDDAPPERDLLFYVSFDRLVVEADYAQGDGRPLDFDDNLEVRVQPGFNNKNAFLRKPKEILAYPARGNVNPMEGTLSVWVKAVNWEPRGLDRGAAIGTHKHFLAIRYRNDEGPMTMTLFKLYRGAHVRFLVAPGKSTRGFAPTFNGALMKKGAWHKLDATWGEGVARIYLDGKLRGQVRYDDSVNRIAKAGIDDKGRILVNPLIWKNNSWDDQTIIDEVKIYGRALSNAEIRQKYRRDLGQKVREEDLVALDLSGLDVDDGTLDELACTIDLNGLPSEWFERFEKGRVDLELTARHGEDVLYRSTVESKKPRLRRVLTGIDRPGQIDVSLTLTDRVDNRSLTVSQSIDRPDTSWLGNTHGLEEVVPEPWTPVEQNGDTVSAWNRVYTFEGPFVAQVESGGKTLLASPVRLMADTGDGEGYREVVWTADAIDPEKQRRDVIERTGRGRLGKLTFTYRTRVWFDGYTRTTLDVGPQGASLNGLRLAYAVRREFSRYLTDPLYRELGPEGAAYGWDATNLKDFSLLWLMGDKHGFAWIPENEGNWVYDKDGGYKPIRCRRGKGPGAPTEVTLDLIAHPVRLPEGVRYNLGFIATPTRPLPKDFRTFCANGRKSGKLNDAVITGWNGKGFAWGLSLIPYNGPDARQPYDAYIETFRKTGWSYYIDCSPVYRASAEPVVSYFASSWRIPGTALFPNHDHRDQKYVTIACTQTRAYRDFFADKVNDYFSTAPDVIGGPYYDMSFVYPNTNPVAGGPFTDAFGRRIPYRLTTFDLRRTLMRNLKICRRHDRRVWQHAHSVYNPAVHGLADFWYPGENWAHRLMNDKFYYTDNMPEGVYLTELNPHQKGVGVINLPVVARRVRERLDEPEPTIAMLGRMFLHDVISSATQCHEPSVARLWAIRKKHDLDRARFVRFDQAPSVASDNKDVACSVYELPGGARLAVVANMTARPQKARLDVGEAASARDEWNEKVLAIDEGAVTVKLPPRGFIPLYLKGE